MTSLFRPIIYVCFTIYVLSALSSAVVTHKYESSARSIFFLISSITGTQFCRLQELSFVHYRNSVLSITGTQFCQLQKQSFVDQRKPVSFRQLQETCFVYLSFISSVSFRFVECRKPLICKLCLSSYIARSIQWRNVPKQILVYP